jgi:putative DNA primase/helicase
MSEENPIKKIVDFALIRGGKNDDIPEHSDLAVAEKFAAIYGGKYRHVTNRNDWFVYDGKVWTPDDKLQRYTDARHLCSDLARACDSDTDKKALTHANTISDVLKMAGYDGSLIAVIEEFDDDPTLLNTQDGVVELSTGKLREHRIEDYFSQITSCGVSDAGCPLWLEFLRVVTGDDPELMAYIKRVIGYTLTGSVKEHALFFLYGEGANGKSVFLGVIAGILNSYHRTAAMQTFIVSTSDQHPTDLAGLVGNRAVTRKRNRTGAHLGREQDQNHHGR